ncbi:hypothetical protein HX848_07185 [Marine Group I thaumarchaeote]|uniref:Uncharacterized protein n=1 Tax=Marine Group I thaumarchaeote TaxID=2511932 RepID=A0A7K4MJK0_9ARCH|nr:hypothetical protein [Marine Group I thaumarchaeote]
MLMKLGLFAIFSLFVLMIVPIYAEVTTITLEKIFYIVDEEISFSGTENEGDKMVTVIVKDPNGNPEVLSDFSDSEGKYETIPQSVKNIFSINGIYNVTAFVDKIEEGITMQLEFDGEKVFKVPDFVLQLKSISDYSVEVEKTITFTASLEDSSVGDVVFSLRNQPIGATIDPSSGKFVWTIPGKYGSFQDVDYSFDIVVNSEAQEDRENITITVKKAYDEPETTEPETTEPETTEPETTEPETTEPEPKELEIPAPFVDEAKEPQSYVDRYINEASYKKWFDDNYPEYSSIYEAIGLEEPIIEEPEFGECGEGTKLIDGKCTIVAIQSKGGGCLIATAAYDSEMAPQIQFLREIRDNQLMNTDSGISFMTGFNQFYYSFSPTIADMQRENPIFKEAVKLWITPLLSSLSVMSYAESESQVIGYGIGVILMNIGMYFVAPAMLFYGIRKVRRVKF